MRYLLITIFCFCFLVSTVNASALVKCYSGGKLVYQGKANKVGHIADEYLVFHDIKLNEYILTNNECIIQVKDMKGLD